MRDGDTLRLSLVSKGLDGNERYDPNKGVKISPILKAGDIGNVLDPASYKGGRTPIRPGTPGLLNSGMTLYGTDGHPSDPATVNDPLNPRKPAQGEIGGDTSKNADGSFAKPLGDRGGLAEMFGVGVRSIERVFGMLDKRGRRADRNFVPVAALGLRPGQMQDFKVDAQGRSIIYSFTRKDRNGNTILGPDGQPMIFTLPQYGNKMRLFTAAALAVEGGLQRVPLYTKGGGRGADVPYELRIEVGTIAEAARSLYGVYSGTYDDRGDVPLSKAWVQMQIEPSGGGWDLVIVMFFPWPWEYDNRDTFDDDPEYTGKVPPPP